jgi:hypothetical protein
MLPAAIVILYISKNIKIYKYIEMDYHAIKKKRRNSFDNIRPNIYAKRVDNNVTKQFKEIHDTIPNNTHMSDEEGLKLAYDSPNRFYHHRNKLFVAGTKDFPQDHLDDLKLPFEDTLNLTKRGRDVEAYYRNHMREIDTVIGDSLGGSVSLALEDKYRHDKIDIPGVGIKQVKTFNAPVVAANLGGHNQQIKDLIVSNSQNLGAVVGGAVGSGLDSLTDFRDGGFFTANASKAGGELGKKIANRLTTRQESNPDRIRYFGDPISVFDFNAKTVMPSLGFRMTHPAHTYKGLSIPDKVPEHDVVNVPLTASPSDNKAQQLTE